MAGRDVVRVPRAGRGSLVARSFSIDGGRFRRNFRNALQKYAGVEKADAFQSGIKQIWIPKINVVDRCVTCHLGYDWGAVSSRDTRRAADAASESSLHGSSIRSSKFGCTPCHGGTGMGDDSRMAHQVDEGWNDPMLSTHTRDAIRTHARRADADAMQLLPSPRCRDAGDGSDQSRQETIQEEKVHRMPHRRRTRRRDRARDHISSATRIPSWWTSAT